MTDEFVVALPSKGTLQAPTIALLERCFLKVTRGSGGRSYNGSISGLPGAAALYARPDEIPEIVRSGRAHVGITGLDLFQEFHDNESSKRLQVLVEDLHFGSAALAIGIPRSWIDVRHLGDLIEVSHDIRHEHGRPMLVATKFTNLTRRYFIDRGLNDFRIVQSLGATEAAPRSGTADIIVDLVSSGATLEANGLTTIDDGVVLQSQACLISGGNLSSWPTSVSEPCQHFLELIDAALRAQQMRTLRATFDTDFDELPEPLCRHLVNVRIHRSESGPHEVVASFDRAHVHDVLAQVKAAGALEANVLASEIMAEYS